jgi:uncharacterized coiled-coil protein SlyX
MAPIDPLHRLQREIDELEHTQGRLFAEHALLATRVSVHDERLKMGDTAIQTAKNKNWVANMIGGLGLVGIFGVGVYFSTKADSTDLTVAVGRITSIERTQAAQTEILATLRSMQADTRLVIEKLSDRIDALTSAIRAGQKRGRLP